MTQAKSQDRIELDLFLELRAEARPVTSPDTLHLHRETVLRKRSPKAYQALSIARETLLRFHRGRVGGLDELLPMIPRMAIACLELLEALDPREGEELKIVDEEIFQDAVAYRLGVDVRARGATRGLAIAYGGGFAGCGGGGGGKDQGGASTGIGYGGMAGGGPIIAGCSSTYATTGQGGIGGCAGGALPPRSDVIGVDPQTNFVGVHVNGQ